MERHPGHVPRAPSDDQREPARMPVTYEFDGPTIALRMTGDYQPADIRHALLAALDDPAGSDATGLLFDVRDSQAIARRSAADVRAMGQFIADHAHRFGHRLALVADTDAAFGLMRLGGVGVEQRGVESRVFRDPAEAASWLRSQPPSAGSADQ